ncbi:MAG TPA: ABC transporter permease [Gemmatimonadaceae bacterium]|nr:ABC transporter permease [Gemmatimonadaceae bacterium]
MWTDLKFAARALRKSPGFTLAAVCSLALGIGACTTIFSAIDAVILRALPFHALDRLVWISASSANCQQCNATPGDYFTLRKDSRTLASVAEFAEWQGTLAGRDEAERIQGVEVTPGFFSTLGVHAAIGRTFDADSASPALAHLVVLGDRLWRARFGADPGIVGRAITIDGGSYTVVGVMPPQFDFPQASDVLLPLSFTAANVDNYLWGHFRLIARLAPGATREQAQREIDVVSSRIATAFPRQRKGWRLVSRPLSEAVLHDLRRFFFPLMGAAVFVLLIVCANIANLTMARASGRQRELAVRTALGAERWRLIRHLLVESTLLGGLGALLGVVLAWRVIPLLRHAIPQDSPYSIPGWETLSVNIHALLFTVGLALASSILFGLVPALRASRSEVTSALKEGGRGATNTRGARVRRGLVIAEFALALILLVSAGLLVQSFAKLLRTDTGMHAERVLTMAVQVPERRYPRFAIGPSAELYSHVRATLGALPGVLGVAGAITLPLNNENNTIWFNIAGRPPLPPGQAPQVDQQIVTPGYFQALGIPLLRGRDFTEHDDSAAAGVAIISQSMAQRYWPGEDPLGRSIVAGGAHLQIIGIAGDARATGVEALPEPTLYQSNAQAGGNNLDLIVRTAGDPAALTASIRRAVASVDRDIAISDVRTMPRVVSDYLAPWRILMTLLGAFALVALVIAAVGIYGVMAYAVVQRTHEIGIRMALGADRAGVRRMVLREGIVLAAAGVAFGVLGALGATRALAFMLYEVSASDPMIIAGVAASLALVALAASWIPARRATTVDPAVAMRAE